MTGYHTRGINIVWGTWQYQGVLDEDSTKHQRELITSLWSAKTRIMIRGRRFLCTALGWVPVNRNSSLKSSTGSAIVLERMQEELAEVSGARNSSRPSIRIRYYDHHFLLFGKSVRRVLPPPPAYGLYARVNDENDGRPLTNSLGGGGLGHLRCLVFIKMMHF